MNGGEPPEPLRVEPSGADNQADGGRKYWKAAIAHLTPEKREAAWEFYLDRLESSPAADTLGGVMLLLEAHLAYFDDFPAKLEAAAQQLESALKPLGDANTASDPSSPHVVPGSGKGASRAQGRRSSFVVVAGASAAIGGIIACAGIFAYQRLRPASPAILPACVQDVVLARASVFAVQPWNDPVTHQEKGCVVLIGNTAWTENTETGGSKVYVRSPVEEVRHNLESLRQLARQPSS